MALDDTDSGLWPYDDDGADRHDNDHLSGAGLAGAIQADLAELRAISMQFARAIAAKAETEAGEEELVRLNAAAAKAARAVRCIAVLQLEIDGQRTLPGARAYAPANQNRPGASGDGGRQNYRTYGDHRDYTDEDRTAFKRQQEWFGEQIALLKPAMEQDFRDARREEALHESLHTQATQLIMSIPHPAVDECLNILDPTFLRMVFGEHLLPPRLGPGPPGVWERFDRYADRRKPNIERSNAAAPPQR